MGNDGLSIISLFFLNVHFLFNNGFPGYFSLKASRLMLSCITHLVFMKTSNLQIIHWEQVQTHLKQHIQAYRDNYYAMYSSIFGGIVTDPTLMLIPLDDHLIHRGDGVFETLKCVNGNMYNLDAHLNRLEQCAGSIDLDLPCTREELISIMIETTRAGSHSDCLLRLFIGRGPGGLGVNPYESIGSTLYIIIAKLKPGFMTQHPQGGRIKSSRIPVKSAGLATIKSVNYLPNVLMKKEAVDNNVDFVVSFDEHDFLAESATENIGILSPDGLLKTPHLHRILAGTTMLRVLQLAQSLVPKALAGIESCNITRDEVIHAQEVFIFGTTPNVTAIVECDGHPIGNGTPGPMYEQLSELLLEDMRSNPDMLTRVFL